MIKWTRFLTQSNWLPTDVLRQVATALVTLAILTAVVAPIDQLLRVQIIIVSTAGLAHALALWSPVLPDKRNLVIADEAASEPLALQ